MTSVLHAQNRGSAWQYQSPLADARMVSPATTIIIRPGDPLEPASITANALIAYGSASGEHRGTIALADDGATLLFAPDRPFASGESVTVLVRDGMRTLKGSSIASRMFSFTTGALVDESTRRAVKLRMLDAERRVSRPEYAMAISPSYASLPESIVPGDSLPVMRVTALNNPSSGNIFLSNISIVGDYPNATHLLRIDNSAVPVFSRKMSGMCGDFKMQPNGTISYCDWDAGAFYLLDTGYAVIDSFRCGNGYTTDPHELMLLPNGHALLLGLDIRTIDMSELVAGGKADAEVTGLVIQELDTAKRVVFEWNSFDHIPITDATFLDMTEPTIDYIHSNAIEVDHDGNLLLSSRHTDEITKIDRSTGEIIWRLGGRGNQFTFIGDSIGFSRQHSIRRLPNGHILLYDNGNTHTPQFSRAVEYALDENAMTATLVWEYRNRPDVYGFAMGSVQRLENGNTVIGWGAGDVAVTEVRPDGTTAFELLLPEGICSYRAFRFPGPQSMQTSLVAPVAGATDIPDEVDLLWNPYQGTMAYRLQMAADSSFTMPLVDTLVIDATVCHLENLSLSQSYYWRVMPITDVDMGRWTDIWWFTTQSLASAPDAVPARFLPTLHAELSGGGDHLLLRYTLPSRGEARITLTDMRGREAAILLDGVADAGEGMVTIDTRGLQNGVYICRLMTGTGWATNKLVVRK